MNARPENEITEGSINFESLNGECFGVYKYQKDWNMYIIRAELRSDIQWATYHVFAHTAILIACMIILFVILGIFMLNKILKNLVSFTNELYSMQQKSQLALIDISKAPNDDITYLATSFNSLS